MTDSGTSIQAGLTAMNNGDPASAARIFRNVLASSPRDPELLHLAALACIQSDQQSRGRKFLQKSLKLAPNNPDANNTLGVMLNQEGNSSEAMAAFERAVNADPNNVRALKNLGSLLTDNNFPERALKVLLQLNTVEPGVATTLNRLGSNYMYLGEFDKAKAYFRETISLDPGHGGGWLSLSELDREMTDADVHTMQDNLNNPEEGGLIAAALFRVFERRKDFTIAGEYLVQANSQRRQQHAYNVSDEEETMARIAESIGPGFLEAAPLPSVPGPAPIFVLGLPRSGTTLIEQILSSHSQVGGAGECNSVYKGLERLSAGPTVEFPALLKKFRTRDYARLGQMIIQVLQDANTGKPFVVDKTTSNYLYVGLIKRLWPDALIVHCQRDPMDCAWSNFRMQFKSANEYSYDQQEIVRYFAAKERLMDHWRTLCPEGVLDLSYEDMVDDQEGQTRRLLDYCGLAWEDACLDFHENTRSVLTASSVQVRSPIYKTSLKAWEPYRDILQPMIKGFAVP
jgi:Tfp pilus assembly protein PilF